MNDALKATLAQIDATDWSVPHPPFALFTHEDVVFIEFGGEQYSLGPEDEVRRIFADFLGIAQ